MKPGFFLGFYFWLDAIVMASLFFEVPSVKEDILGMNEVYPSLQDQTTLFSWAGDRAFIGSKGARVARVGGVCIHLVIWYEVQYG